jgi:hypothetical protein
MEARSSVRERGKTCEQEPIGDRFRADRILEVDERLTRQFGKTLTMLIRLRELRLAVSTAA